MFVRGYPTIHRRNHSKCKNVKTFKNYTASSGRSGWFNPMIYQIYISKQLEVSDSFVRRVQESTETIWNCNACVNTRTTVVAPPSEYVISKYNGPCIDSACLRSYWQNLRNAVNPFFFFFTFRVSATMCRLRSPKRSLFFLFVLFGFTGHASTMWQSP